MKKKANLGCGPVDFGKDWYHVDIIPYEHVDHDDMGNLPWTDLELIYSSHALAYYDRTEGAKVLAHWYDCLAKGGVVQISVPDFQKLVYYYQQNKPLERILGPLYGKIECENGYIYEKCVYDEASLCAVLHAVGFRKISEFDHSGADYLHIDDCSHAPISLNLQAIK